MYFTAATAAQNAILHMQKVNAIKGAVELIHATMVMSLTIKPSAVSLPVIVSGASSIIQIRADAMRSPIYAIQKRSIVIKTGWFAATVKVPAMATNAITPFVIPLSHAKTDRDALPAVV